MYDVTKDGKTFEELKSEIEQSTFRSYWKQILNIVYPSNDVLDDSWPELDGEELYKRLRPFQLVDGVRVFSTKLNYTEISAALGAYKASLILSLENEFIYLQRQKDFGDRINNIKNWKQAANDLNLFSEFTNISLLTKKIVDENLESELSLLEAKDLEITTESDFQAKVDIMQQGQTVGSRVIAVIAQLNTDNGVTPTQLNAIYSNPFIQAILALLQTGALNSAKFQIQNLDLTGLEPITESYKSRIIAMIDKALGI